MLTIPKIIINDEIAKNIASKKLLSACGISSTDAAELKEFFITAIEDAKNDITFTCGLDMCFLFCPG